MTKRVFVLLVLFFCGVYSMTSHTTTCGAKKKAKLSKTSTSLYVGKSMTLKVKNNKKKVKWSSSDKTIAKVSSKGKVTGLKEGKAKITAKVKKKKYVCKVTVKEKEEKIVYNNSVFTEELYNSIVSVSIFLTQPVKEVTSKAEISKMYKLLAAISTLTDLTGKWEKPQGLIGGTQIILTLKNGSYVSLDYTAGSEYLGVGGTFYKLENDADIQSKLKAAACVRDALKKLH